MKEHGFTVVEVVVVVVLLVVVGGGVYVWQQKTLGGKQQNAPAVTNSGHNSAASPSASPTSSPTKPSPTVDVTAGWKTITDAGGVTNVSFMYPPDWSGPGKAGGCIHLTTPDGNAFCYVEGPYVNDGETVDGLVSRISRIENTITKEADITVDGHAAKREEYYANDGSNYVIETYIADVAASANTGMAGRKGTLVVRLSGRSISAREHAYYDEILSTYKLED